MYYKFKDDVSVLAIVLLRSILAFCFSLEPLPWDCPILLITFIAIEIDTHVVYIKIYLANETKRVK